MEDYLNSLDAEEKEFLEEIAFNHGMGLEEYVEHSIHRAVGLIFPDELA